MDRLHGMNRALEYIEEHLGDDIEYQEMARLAGFSFHHFQRLFALVTDVTLAEYIRRRRLTMAAFELQSSKTRVIDLAMKYGYDSPNSFTRAFQKLNGVTPTQARRKGASLKSYPRMSFAVSIKGVKQLDYRIEQTDEYVVFGKSFAIGIEDNVFEAVPRFWRRCQNDGTYQRLGRAAGFEPYSGKLLNGAFYDSGDARRHRGGKYIIHTALKPKVEVPPEFDLLTIPRSKWVVFSATFKTAEESLPALHNLWKRIYTEWFPTSTLRVTDGPHLEVFQSYSVEEVWLPVED